MMMVVNRVLSVSVCYVAVRTIVLPRHGCFPTTFLGSRRMETVPTSIEIILRSTLVQSDKPSNLRGFLSPTTRHRCMYYALVYTAPGTCITRWSRIQLWTRPDVA